MIPNSVFGFYLSKNKKLITYIRNCKPQKLIKKSKNRFKTSNALLSLNSLYNLKSSHTLKVFKLINISVLFNLSNDFLYLFYKTLPNYIKLTRKYYSFKSNTDLFSHNPMFSNILTKTYKTSYKDIFPKSSIGSTNKNNPITNITFNDKLSLIKSFNSYLRINTNIGNQTFYSHASLVFTYFYRTKFGISVTSLPRLFNKWRESYLLLFNLFFFNIEILAFGSSFFKKETLALNWKVFNQFKFMWRYTKPILMFSPNRIFNYGDMVFRKIRLLGLNIAYITDVLYHNKTIYYLHRAGFYTIGPVPSNFNINAVNYAIPAGDDNLLTQLFFIRFVLSIQRLAKLEQFKQNNRYWRKFKLTLL